MEKISVIIPLYNEADNIAELHRRLKDALQKDFATFDYEIIFVDDGSSDAIESLLLNLHTQDPKVKVLQFSRNFGHHIAITAGLDYASGDYVVMMDGDLQDQPEEIIKLYRQLKSGYDVVYGERVQKKFSLFRRILSGLFNFLIKRFIDEPIVINSTIFRIMTKQVVESIRLLRERNRYIVGIIGWVGFKHAGVPVEHGKRYKGESKYNLSRQLALAWNAIFSFSSYPLKWIIRLGLLCVALAFALGIFIIVKKIMYNTPIIGWSSLMVSILILGGLQITILGVIGEYLGRNYMEDKNRPLYIIKNYWHD